MTSMVIPLREAQLFLLLPRCLFFLDNQGFVAALGENQDKSRPALSASAARANSTWKNSWLWPVSSPVPVRNCTAAVAPASEMEVGRMIEQSGKSVLMNLQGLGMTCDGSVASLASRSGKTNPSPLFTGGICPTVSCQISKCAPSVPPMLVTIRRARRLLHFKLRASYRLEPPCSIIGK